ncbi:MAG: OmpA family protein [Deltaproteobacteria bacterium]|nr:OmpA family protein [Deltaproteobacteria bacterium]
MVSLVQRFAMLGVLVTAVPVAAESGRLNLDVDLALGAPFTGRYGSTVVEGLGAAQAYGGHLVAGLDYQVFRPLALEVIGGAGFQVIPPITNAYNGQAEEFTVAPQLYVGAGPRLRFFDDQPGGNLWTAAHVGVGVFDGAQFGLDAALGYQLGMGALSIGPFVRAMLLFDSGTAARHTLLGTVGLAASFDAIPFEVPPPPMLDRDGDGVNDDVDRAPDDPEDKDGFEDQDGAPEPDNDRDGVLDGSDRCPNEAGMSSFHGCPPPPVLDKDGDGINDDVDGAPDQPEDKDGFEDGNGIPDPDNDKDGVLDVDDRCPFEPGIADEQGCPLVDTDKDGVVDRADNCPAEAGPVDNQGCPAAKKQLVVVTREALKILDMVYFDTGKATIQPRSFPLLDQVAGIIVEKTWIKQVRVEGHTDSQGVPDKNQKLSDARANSVRDYLIKKGVDGSRLVAQGFGQDKPIASNDTARGRASNRRVEFKVVEAE